MESKEFQRVGASRGAGSTDNGKDKIESGSDMGSLDPKSHLVAGSSNAAFLGSADTGNLKVDTCLKATINSLGSSNNQDLDMGPISLAKDRPRKTKKKSAIEEGLETAVETRRAERRRRIDKILSDLQSMYSTTTEEESNADGTAEEESNAGGTAEEESNAGGTAVEESNADEMISTYMDPELYRAATAGDVGAFAAAVGDAERMLIEKVTPKGNSVLHLAASFGHESIVNFILQKCPELVERKNQKGDLALHVAASAGHLTLISSLVSFAQNFASRGGSNTVGATLLSGRNQQGNTPLHVALENGQQETALFLVQADPQVSYCLNREGKSPLYMATKSGYLEIVKHMTTEDPNGLDSYNQGKIAEQKEHEKHEASRLSDYPKDHQLLHASIIGRNKDVMDRIWSTDSSLMSSTDEKGRTPLTLAALIGFVDGVCYILDKSAESAYLRDQEGFFPIHWACTRGHIEIIDAFISRLPDSADLLNKQGENILHVAAKNGRAKLVSWMLKLSELDMLINEKDKYGFTPLHWATVNCHPKVVSTLTWDKRVNLEIMDNYGWTALDIAESEIQSYAAFRRRLTRTALKSANAPRSENAKTRRQKRTANDSAKPPNPERVNTLVLVATLVATVTFACGFTLPGGIHNSDPNLGMATMVTKAAFQAFLICSTTALYSSILVAVILIWAQLGDKNLVINTLRIAVPLLGVALVAMSSAFISGVYLVVSNHRWLAILVLIMGSISIAILSVIFFSLCFPLSSKSRIGRYLMYYPIELMILISGSDIEKAIEEELPEDAAASDMTW